jgi:hypothetical protein
MTEAMALYSNVSQVSMLKTVRRNRLLAHPGEVIMPVGQQVTAANIVARAPAISNFQIVEASELIEVQPDDLLEYLLVREGDLISKGAPLMQKKTIFGQNKVFRSPSEGYLHQIRDGCLVIETVGESIELRAMMPGRIVSVIPDQGVVIEAHGSVIQTRWDSGKDGFGKLMFNSPEPDAVLEPNLAGKMIHGMVLVAGSVKNPQVFEQLHELGARGLIVGSISYQLSEIAGQADIPVVATEGLGNKPLSQPIFDLLQQSQGRQASLLSANTGQYAQSGEIVIPLPTTSYPPKPGPEENQLTVGSTVRILHSGSNSLVGKVNRIYEQPKGSPIGIISSGADVEFEDGQIMFVNIHNLDKLF